MTQAEEIAAFIAELRPALNAIRGAPTDLDAARALARYVSDEVCRETQGVAEAAADIAWRASIFDHGAPIEDRDYDLLITAGMWAPLAELIRRDSTRGGDHVRRIVEVAKQTEAARLARLGAARGQTAAILYFAYHGARGSFAGGGNRCP